MILCPRQLECKFLLLWHTIPVDSWFWEVHRSLSEGALAVSWHLVVVTFRAINSIVSQHRIDGSFMVLAFNLANLHNEVFQKVNRDIPYCPIVQITPGIDSLMDMPVAEELTQRAPDWRACVNGADEASGGQLGKRVHKSD